MTTLTPAQALTGVTWTQETARDAVAALFSAPNGARQVSELYHAIKQAQDADSSRELERVIMESFEKAGVGVSTVAGVMFMTYDYPDGHSLYEEATVYFRDGSTEEWSFDAATDPLRDLYGSVVAEDAGLCFLPGMREFEFFETNAEEQMPAWICQQTGAKTRKQHALDRIAHTATVHLAYAPDRFGAAGVNVKAIVFPPSPQRQAARATVHLNDGSTVVEWFPDDVNDRLSWLAHACYGTFPGVVVNPVTETAATGAFEAGQLAEWLAGTSPGTP